MITLVSKPRQHLRKDMQHSVNYDQSLKISYIICNTNRKYFGRKKQGICNTSLIYGWALIQFMAWEADYGLQQSMAQYVEGRTTIDTKTEWKCGGCGISAGSIHGLLNKD